NIPLGCTPGINKRSVSELVLSYSLGHCRNVFASDYLMKQGIWEKNGGKLLSSTKFGIIGLGYIGSDLAALLKAFQCEVYYNDIEDKSQISEKLGVKFLSFHEILRKCDIISFHVPLTPLTKSMFNDSVLEMTKQGMFIINTSRGEVVDLPALQKGIEGKILSGFALDVFPNEPFDSSIWSSTPNIICTPHIGGNAKEAVFAMGSEAINHIEAFLRNRIL
ncbi:MAG: hypothetical protein K2X39_10045, partial [Silvanigrellaceae bacterium]|nr:hypothetical protein [Silvanigrellaceae bacterium]